MKWIILGLLLFPSVLALTFENGSQFRYDDVRFTWKLNETLTSLEVLDAPSTAVLDGTHSISFKPTCNETVNISVYYWDGLNHSFDVFTPVPCSVPYDIKVNSTPYIFKSAGAFLFPPLNFNTSIIKWVYELQSVGGVESFGMLLLWLPMMMMFITMIYLVKLRKKELREKE